MILIHLDKEQWEQLIDNKVIVIQYIDCDYWRKQFEEMGLKEVQKWGRVDFAKIVLPAWETSVSFWYFPPSDFKGKSLSGYVKEYGKGTKFRQGVHKIPSLYITFAC